MPWLLILAAYTLLGLLLTSRVWIDYAYARHPLTWWRAAAVALAAWYSWAFVTPWTNLDATLLVRPATLEEEWKHEIPKVR